MLFPTEIVYQLSRAGNGYTYVIPLIAAAPAAFTVYYRAGDELPFVTVRQRQNFYHSTRNYQFRGYGVYHYKPKIVLNMLTGSRIRIFENKLGERKYTASLSDTPGRGSINQHDVAD